MSIDILTITQPGVTARQVRLSQTLIKIGRAPTNEVVLDEAVVGEEHAVLERKEGGWVLTDLGSETGTFLEQTRILSEVAEVWPAGVMMRIGPYQMWWQTEVVDPEEPEEEEEEDRPEPVEGQIIAQIIPPALVLEAGEQNHIEVELLNQGIPVDHFQLTVSGVPQEWVAVSEPLVQLMPDQKSRVSLLFHPPRSSQTVAGQYPFTIQATASSTGREVMAGQGVLTIKPFTQFQANIHPTQLENKGTVVVNIQNEGNTRSGYAVSATDNAEALIFRSEAVHAQIEPGQAKELAFRVRPQWRHWFGQDKVRPFTIAVRGQDGTAQEQPGVLTVQPVIPAWLRPYLRVALLILLVVAAGVIALRDRDNDDLPAIVEWLWGSSRNNPDSDGDGLLDTAERRYGTNPRDPDSDHDGLNDWAELFQYNTSPLLIDSDCDRIPDGAEVESFETNPRDPFTAGENRPDWAENYAYAADLEYYACSTPTPFPTPSSEFTNN